MGFVLRSARFLAQDALRAHLRPGDTAVDATLGNGHDACFLAELVGEGGRVIGLDVQAEAVARSQARLAAAGLLGRCRLLCLGHEHLAQAAAGPVDAVMFNLGWLPGGDKALTTRWETTRQGVEAALELLRPGGLLTVCVYPGHPAGETERQGLTAYFAALAPQAFNVLHQRFLTAGPGAPECFLVQRQGAEG